MHSNYDYQIPPSPSMSEQEPPNQPLLYPVLSGWEQKPEGKLHAEVGPKPKLNPRSCVKKEEKEKSLLVDSGAVD